MKQHKKQLLRNENRRQLRKLNLLPPKQKENNMLNEGMGTGEGTGMGAADPGATGEGAGANGKGTGGGEEARSNTRFLADMLKLRGEPDVGEEDGQMTAEQAAVARLEFKDSMRDNMDAFQELLPEGTRSQSQSFIEGIIAGDTSMIISAVKNAVMGGIEQEGRGEEPRSLKVEGSGSGQMGKGNQKPARSLSEAQQRMSNMFGPMR